MNLSHAKVRRRRYATVRPANRQRGRRQPPTWLLRCWNTRHAKKNQTWSFGPLLLTNLLHLLHSATDQPTRQIPPTTSWREVRCKAYSVLSSLVMRGLFWKWQATCFACFSGERIAGHCSCGDCSQLKRSPTSCCWITGDMKTAISASALQWGEIGGMCFSSGYTINAFTQGRTLGLRYFFLRGN